MSVEESEPCARIEKLTAERDTLSMEVAELMDQVRKESESIPPIREAITDRHESICYPKYGQPIHSCPDPICRDAYAALEVLS